MKLSNNQNPQFRIDLIVVLCFQFYLDLEKQLGFEKESIQIQTFPLSPYISFEKNIIFIIKQMMI
jgi:hypothetical protein